MTTPHSPTPRPWFASDLGLHIYDASGHGICEMRAGYEKGETQANAGHIVRCVNAHDALVAACRTLGAIVENECKMVDGAMRAAVAARDAIRKAEA